MTWIMSAICLLQLDLDAYRWKSRLLLQFGDQPRLSSQTQSAFKERDLVLLPANTPELRKAFKVNVPYTLILIGKDGGEKARWLTPIDPQIILNLIDSMPMRQSELRRKSN
jgi:hypothetical protein